MAWRHVWFAASSMQVGLGLWQQIPLALTVEALCVAGGLWLYLPGAPLTRAKRRGLAILVLMALAFTIVGMTLAPAPPSVPALALSSLLTVGAVAALAWWLGRVPSVSSAP